MAAVELRRTAGLLRSAPRAADETDGRSRLADELDALAKEIEEAIRAEAVVVHRRTGAEVFAYEVDGFGNALHMDDANAPSLLSLPYLGFTTSGDPTYRATLCVYIYIYVYVYMYVYTHKYVYLYIIHIHIHI